MDLKKRLYELRTERGYSVAVLAKKAGVAASHVQRIESGERKPTVDVMEKICHGLGISLKNFFTENDTEISIDMLEFIDKAKKLTPEQIRAFNILLTALDK